MALFARAGHRGAITGLAFRRAQSAQLFSASDDRTVKVWDADEQLYIDTLYGHQAAVLAVAANNKERCVTVGADRTLRVWKILEESQLIFHGHRATIDWYKFFCSFVVVVFVLFRNLWFGVEESVPICSRTSIFLKLEIVQVLFIGHARSCISIFILNDHFHFKLISFEIIIFILN